MARHAAPLSVRPRRVPLGSVVLLSAVALVGAGTFAAWQSTAGATTGTYSAATVSATDADANGTTFTSAISNLLPGDYAYRYRTLTNTGSVSQSFAGAVTGSNTLAATAGGLTIKVESCPVAWSGSTCASPTTVLATTGVSTSPTITYGTLAAGGALNLRYTFALPSNADQTTFQGTSGTVQVAITGTSTGGNDRT